MLNIFTPIIIEARNKEHLVFEMNQLKYDEDIFNSLLKKSVNYETSLEDYKILFGNTSAKTLITIFTNPHCEPCGIMNKRVEDLLKKTDNRYCVQYIFSSFNKELEISSQMLIAAYLGNNKGKTELLYSKWFERGKYNKEEFFKINNI